MKIVAFVPIKMNSVRLKKKNILPLCGHPLCWHIINTLLQIDVIDGVYVYCSDESIVDFIPSSATFFKRDASLDGDLVKGESIYKSFIKDVDADIYILAHATSPFIRKETIEEAVRRVKTGEYDSAFSAKKIQNFVWYQGEPLNYSLKEVPRTQDLEPVWIETSAFFIFKKELFVNENRRIGHSPYVAEVNGIEAIDIDTKEDFDLATAYSRLIKKEYE